MSACRCELNYHVYKFNGILMPTCLKDYYSEIINYECGTPSNMHLVEYLNMFFTDQ